MSILIRGVEMPQDCFQCTFQGNPVCIKIMDFGTRGARPSGCPLIEIPDGHGRLIDEDVLKEMAQKERGNYDAIWRKSLYSMGEILHAIECTPTVIQSDKEGE